ncbi:rhodanese-like domain-containing protein [Erythrobacter crassostreae]|uniref:Rhodanese-like domain-containing protein n=1 Tax=Erythrobacter crassostreae TaxID=2828328 RepID=A0A9X1F0N3_9SPHN|nr:rhodanese-like domain-containing protein [Erythrobacter crassostrea]MBV7258180.1 rhodanese-like domain-containing protein [Erythrobacter crassostrea]
MIDLRFSLTVAAALGLCACAPSDSEDSDTPSAPPGFELASAKQATQQSDKSEAYPTEENESLVWEMTPEELGMYIESGHATIIDVRTAEEVADGMIPGAEHMPLDEFDPSKIKMSPYMTVVLYCRSGRRSAIAAEKLARHTGEPAAHLAGGYIAWVEAGSPTQ